MSDSLFKGNRNHIQAWKEIYERHEAIGAEAGSHYPDQVPEQVLELLPHAVKGVLSYYTPEVLKPTTTTLPPVIWFPDIHKGRYKGFYFKSIM